MQDAIPRRGFHRIKVHDLIGSISAVAGGHREKLWREFFLNPSQWWDHRSEKELNINPVREFTCRWSHSSCWC
jgi:hypothetical protein